MMRACGRPSRRAAFTLLEAVIALAVLGAVIVSVLSVRSQSMAQSERLAERQAAERERESLFRMFLSGTLDAGERVQDEDSTTWTGEHLGREYEIMREYTRIENPMTETGRVVSPVISLWKYTVRFEGRTSAFFWHS
ncbi:MAG: type II secretion system protein [Phycisphaerales bacterium]